MQKVHVAFTSLVNGEEFIGAGRTLDSAKALVVDSDVRVVMFTQYEHINYAHDKDGNVLATIRSVDFQ